MEQQDRWWPTRSRWRKAEAALMRATTEAYLELGSSAQAPATSIYFVSHKAGKTVIDLTNIDLPPETSDI